MSNYGRYFHYHRTIAENITELVLLLLLPTCVLTLIRHAGPLLLSSSSTPLRLYYSVSLIGVSGEWYWVYTDFLWSRIPSPGISVHLPQPALSNDKCSRHRTHYYVDQSRVRTAKSGSAPLRYMACVGMSWSPQWEWRRVAREKMF